MLAALCGCRNSSALASYLGLVIVNMIPSHSAANLQSAHQRLQMRPKGRRHQQTAWVKKQMFPKQMYAEISQTQVYKTHLKLALNLKILKIMNSFLTVNLSLRLYSNKMGHISLPLTAAAPPTEAVVFFDFSKPMTLVS